MPRVNILSQLSQTNTPPFIFAIASRIYWGATLVAPLNF
jgi:hypothetical protein